MDSRGGGNGGVGGHHTKGSHGPVKCGPGCHRSLE